MVILEISSKSCQTVTRHYGSTTPSLYIRPQLPLRLGHHHGHDMSVQLIVFSIEIFEETLYFCFQAPLPSVG